MLTIMVNLLILVVIALVVFMVVRYILDLSEADPPIRKLVLLIVGVVFIIAIVNLISGHPLWGPWVQIP